MSKKILVAESSRLVKKLLVSLLEDYGFDVVTAENGHEALMQLWREKPDCIMCGTELPVIQGFELSRIIKGRKAFNIPVLLFSITNDEYPPAVINRSMCDELMTVDTSEPEQMKGKILRFLDGVKERTHESEKETDWQTNLFMFKEITKFYQDESELLNITKSLFTVYSTTKSQREAALNVLDALLEFVPYDIVLLSVRENDMVHDICRLKTALTPEEINDFMIVSHNYFESSCGLDEQFKYQECIYTDEGPLQEYKARPELKIKSTESAVMYGNVFTGTITIGSTKAEIYHEKNSIKFQTFAEKLAPYAENIINSFIMEKTMGNLRKAFSSFVPEEIIDDLIQKTGMHTEQAGQKRKVAVMICDIRNFTNISEGNKPEDVVGFLNTYFTEMVDIIKSHGGSIDKFMGDAIMALFGAPVSYEDNAQRAVEAALDMIKKVPEIDSSRLILPEGYDKISIGIGIHYGEAIFGSIGCSDKRDYTVIGDTVNLASRLEGLTKMYGKKIIVSDSVAGDLNEEISVHKLDKVAVKGKKIPVSIFAVDAEGCNHDDEHYRNYEKGLYLYETGSWTLARDYFEKAENDTGYEKAAGIMLERCQEYIRKPPENWNGAITLTSK